MNKHDECRAKKLIFCEIIMDDVNTKQTCFCKNNNNIETGLQKTNWRQIGEVTTELYQIKLI